MFRSAASFGLRGAGSPAMGYSGDIGSHELILLEAACLSWAVQANLRFAFDLDALGGKWRIAPRTREPPFGRTSKYGFIELFAARCFIKLRQLQLRSINRRHALKGDGLPVPCDGVRADLRSAEPIESEIGRQVFRGAIDARLDGAQALAIGIETPGRTD